MSKVYAVRRAFDPYYRELDFSVTDIARYSPDEVPLDDVDFFSELNSSMAAWWQPIIANFYDDEDDRDKDIPEICPWTGATLVLSPRACRLLKDTLKNDGEFLPLKIKGEEYQLFNCLNFGIDDREASEIEIDGDIQLWVNKLVVAPKEGQTVFKSHLENGQTLFASDKFKNVVEQFGLKGLSFDENLIEKFE